MFLFLKERLESLEAKLDIRRKQFHVFFTSLHLLQSAVEADDSLGNETFDIMDEDDEDVSALISNCLTSSPDVSDHIEVMQET